MTTHPFEIELHGSGNGFSRAAIEIDILGAGGGSVIDPSGIGTPAELEIKNLGKPATDINITSLGGLPGANGDDAYQVAVENGFVGTETEWLESLKAPFTGFAFFPGTGNPDDQVVPNAKPGDWFMDAQTGNVYKLGD